MADPVYASGKLARVYNPDTSLTHSFDKWELEGECATPDVSNFRTAPYPARLAGMLDATINLSGPKDQSGDDNYSLGASVTVRLYWNATQYLKCPGIITRYRASQEAKDAGRIQLTIRPTGSLSVPLAIDGQTSG